jgi:hypothetical protein
MRYVFENGHVKDILTKRDSNSKISVFCFYELGESQEKNFLGFLQSFLWQLLESFPALANSIAPIFQQIQRQSAEQNPLMLAWSESDTLRALSKISEQGAVRGNICLFVDALDECDGGTMSREDIQFIIDLQQWKGIKIHLCVASRPETDLILRHRKFPGLEVQDWTLKDIAEYVSPQLELSYKLVDHDSTTETRSYLVDLTTWNSEGVFLWVKLGVKELQNSLEAYEDEETSLEELIRTMPAGINELYSAIFAKIPLKDLHHCINYLHAISLISGLGTLQQLCFADEGVQKALDRPMGARISIEEMLVRCRRMKGRVLKRTGNLIEVEDCVQQPRSSFRLSAADLSLAKETALLRAGVLYVHRTLPEFMKKKEIWSLIVARANSELSTDGYLSMMVTHLSRFKTSLESKKYFVPTEKEDFEDFLPSEVNAGDLRECIEASLKDGILHYSFLDVMFTQFEQTVFRRNYWFDHSTPECTR